MSKISEFAELTAASVSGNEWLAVGDTGTGTTYKSGPNAVGGLCLLESGSAVTTSSVKAIDLSPYTNYNVLKLFFHGLTFDTASEYLRIRFSDDGTTFESDTGDYNFSGGGVFSTNDDGFTNFNDDPSTNIGMSNFMGNGAGDAAHYEINIYDWQSTANYTMIRYWGQYYNGAVYTTYGGGNLNALDDITDIQWGVVTGDIDGGTYALYGVAGL